MELAVENVNVADLLQQALAEFSDKIEASTLTFRVRADNPKVTVPLDGRKTWRVFENLISNALKYAMPHTRVYLTLTEEADKVVFTISNVAAYELNFDVDEIFERFKRGDPSRNTEGSGLGLAIAKSIVELQGGQLRIDIDGDYFKVRVEFAREAKAAAS
ncbi:ATP-binding protein [Paenibacillus elgii]